MFNNIKKVNNINGDIMKKSNSYHLFLFLTTFTRGIVESFSLVLLYKKGFGRFRKNKSENFIRK